MIRTFAKASIAALLLWGGSASAQGVFEAHASVSIPTPTITFEAPPPLVVVDPGVYVVEDYDQEVFFVDGWSWSRHGEGWYRTRDYRGGWVAAPPRYVPARLVRMPPGRYRHFRSGPGHPMYRSRGPEPRREHFDEPRGRGFEPHGRVVDERHGHGHR